MLTLLRIAVIVVQIKPGGIREESIRLVHLTSSRARIEWREGTVTIREWSGLIELVVRLLLFKGKIFTVEKHMIQHIGCLIIFFLKILI